jgi:hypothetical protein
VFNARHNAYVTKPGPYRKWVVFCEERQYVADGDRELFRECKLPC